MGVLAFELVAGVPPFMHEDRMVMYRRIEDGVYTCPAHFSAVSGGWRVQAVQYCGEAQTLIPGLNSDTDCVSVSISMSRAACRLQTVLVCHSHTVDRGSF